MINLNLISPEKKNEFKAKRVYIIIKKLIIIFLIFSIFLAVIFIISNHFMKQKLMKIVNKNIYSIESSQTINKRITNINEKVTQIEKIQKNFKKWSTLLTHLSEITPQSISFTFVNINYQVSSIEIKGIARTRNDLLSFENNLKNSEILSNVNLPLNDLLAQENNNFNIRANINLERLP